MNNRHLFILAALEGLVMASALLRLAIPGLGIDFGDQRQILWLAVTLFIAAAAVSHFVLRTARLKLKAAAGEQVEEEDRRQILTVSLAILAAAGLLSLAGPQAFSRLLG